MRMGRYFLSVKTNGTMGIFHGSGARSIWDGYYEMYIILKIIVCLSWPLISLFLVPVSVM